MKTIAVCCLLFSTQAVRLRDASDDMELALYADTIANNDQKQQNQIKQKGTLIELVHQEQQHPSPPEPEPKPS